MYLGTHISIDSIIDYYLYLPLGKFGGLSMQELISEQIQLWQDHPNTH